MTSSTMGNSRRVGAGLITAALILLSAMPGSVRAQTDGAQAPDRNQVSSGPLPAPEARVLVPGDPPLTEGMATLFASFITYCYDIPLTGPRLERLRASLVTDWKKNDRAAIKDHLDALKMAQEVAALPAGDRDLFKWGNYVQVVRDAHASQDPDMKWLAAQCDAVHPALAAGTPPLTRPVAEATMYTNAFMLQEAQGISLLGQPGYKEQAIQAVIANYKKLSSAQQESLTAMPLVYGTLKYAWPKLTEAQRNKLRAEWRQQLGPGPQQAQTPTAHTVPHERTYYMHTSMLNTMMYSHGSIMRAMRP